MLSIDARVVAGRGRVLRRIGASRGLRTEGGNRMNGQDDAPKRERHDGFGERRRAQFLDALAETCNVRHSAARTGISASSVYKAYRRDPAFAAQWMEALAEGYVRLEEKLLAHALRELRGDETDDGPDEQNQEGARLRAPTEGAGVAAGKSPFTDTRLAFALLNRHHSSVAGGRMSPVKGRCESTPEATDAALRRRLDALARIIEREERGGKSAA